MTRVVLRACAAAVALVALVVPAAAQTRSVGVGVKAGATVTTLSAPDILSEERDDIGTPAVVPEWFIATTWYPHRVVGFQVELGLVRRGVRLPDGDVDDDLNDDRRIDVGYWELPLLLKLTAPGSRTMQFYTLTGASVGRRQSAALRLGNTQDDVSDRVRANNWSGVGAVGLQGRRWQVEARWSEGLSHIAVEDDKDRVRTRSFSLLMGLRF